MSSPISKKIFHEIFVKIINTLQEFLFLDIKRFQINNNLGPDRLPGQMALDPNYFRQLTFWFHDLCLEVLIEPSNELHKGIPSTHSYYKCRESDIAAVG